MTVTGSGTCNSLAGRVARFRGVDTAQPFLNVPIPAANVVSQNTNHIDTGSETSVAPEAMLLVASFVNDNNGITQGTGWNGTLFATNTLDSCTSLTSDNVALGNCRRTSTAVLATWH